MKPRVLVWSVGRFAMMLGLLALSGAFIPTATIAATKIENVAIITPASKTNGGWDEQGVNNITSVTQKRGIKLEVAENAGYEDITPILQDLKDSGAQLIFCHASGYQTICPEFAAENNVPVAIIENPKAVKPGLISDIETHAEDVAYLAGVMAGKETRTGTVAIVVSAEPPTWNFMSVGFAEGLKATRPDAKLIYSVIGQAAYDDAANAKRTTDSVLAAGADIVFGMGDGASFGMIQSIKEFNQGKPVDKQARFIDVIGDKSKTAAKSFLLSSVLFDYTNTYNQMIDDLQNGTFGKVYTLDVKNGGVHLLNPPIPVQPGTMAAVDAAKEKIVKGEIKVSTIGDANGVHKRLKELFPGS